MEYLEFVSTDPIFLGVLHTLGPAKNSNNPSTGQCCPTIRLCMLACLSTHPPAHWSIYPPVFASQIKHTPFQTVSVPCLNGRGKMMKRQSSMGKAYVQGKGCKSTWGTDDKRQAPCELEGNAQCLYCRELPCTTRSSVTLLLPPKERGVVS